MDTYVIEDEGDDEVRALTRVVAIFHTWELLSGSQQQALYHLASGLAALGQGRTAIVKISALTSRGVTQGDLHRLETLEMVSLETQESDGTRTIRFRHGSIHDFVLARFVEYRQRHA